MATISTLSVSLNLMADNFNNGLRDAQREAKAFEATIKPTTKLLDDMGAAMTSAGQTMTIGLTLPIVAFGVAAVSNFNDAAKASALMENAIRSTGGAAGKSADELRRLATSLQGNSIFDDDQIIGRVLTQLLTFTKVSGEAFDRGAQAALNMSTVLGTDLQSSAIQVGKALNDPVAGVTALQRVGVKLDDTQKDLIKSFMAVNNIAGAQNVILKELETQFGGAAKAASEVGSGPMTQLWVKIGNLTESWGELITKAIIPFIGYANSLVDWLGTLDTSTQTVILAVAAFAAAIGPVLLVLGTMATSLSSIMVLFAQLTPLISGAGGLAGAMTLLGGAGGVIVLAGFAIVALIAIYQRWADATSDITTRNAAMKRSLDDSVTSAVVMAEIIGRVDKSNGTYKITIEELETVMYKARQEAIRHQAQSEMNALTTGVLSGSVSNLSVSMSVSAETTGRSTVKVIEHKDEVVKATAAVTARIAEDKKLIDQFMATRAAEEQNEIVTTMFALNMENATEVTKGLRAAQISLADGNDKLEQMMHAADLAEESIVGLGGAMAGLKAVPPPVWAPDLDAANDAALRLAETARNNLKTAVNDVRESAGKIFDDMLLKGENVFTSLKNALSGGALSLGRSIFQDITSAVFGPILDAFRTSVFEPIKAGFSSLFGGIMESTGLKSLLAKLGSKIGGVISGAIGIGGGAAGAAGGAGGAAGAGGLGLSGAGSAIAGFATNPVTIAVAAALAATVIWLKTQAHWQANTFVKEFQNPLQGALAKIVDTHVATMAAGKATVESTQAAIIGIEALWEQFQESSATFAAKGSDEATVAKQGLETIGPLIKELLASTNQNLKDLQGDEVAKNNLSPAEEAAKYKLKLAEEAVKEAYKKNLEHAELKAAADLAAAAVASARLALLEVTTSIAAIARTAQTAVEKAIMSTGASAADAVKGGLNASNSVYAAVIQAEATAKPGEHPNDLALAAAQKTTAAWLVSSAKLTADTEKAAAVKAAAAIEAQRVAAEIAQAKKLAAMQASAAAESSADRAARRTFAIQAATAELAAAVYFEGHAFGVRGQAAAFALRAAEAMPAYATGDPFVEKTGPAIVHRGERVVTASDNESLTDLLREMIAIGKANLAAVREKTKLYVDGKDLARNQAGHLYDLTRNEGVVLIGRR